MITQKKLYRLGPFLDYKVWGGEKLAQKKNVPKYKSQLPLGETWEVSTLSQEKASILCDFQRPLSDFVKLPYLVKCIDTSDNLSVQVHPQNREANAKSECWLVIDHLPGAQIFVGLKKGVTLKEVEDELIKGQPELSHLLNAINVYKNQFISVPAGTIHAIGAGITLIEVQQPSDVTYRFWDWNRVDQKGSGRVLHIEEAKKSLNREQIAPIFSLDCEQRDFFSIQDSFTLDYLVFVPGETRRVDLKKGQSLVVVSGNCQEVGHDTFEEMTACLSFHSYQTTLKNTRLDQNLLLLLISPPN